MAVSTYFLPDEVIALLRKRQCDNGQIKDSSSGRGPQCTRVKSLIRPQLISVVTKSLKAHYPAGQIFGLE